MSPIRTRAKARARKENADVPSMSSGSGGSLPSSKVKVNSHQARVQTIKHAYRRQTIFNIEQGGQRVEILADRTARINTQRKAKERRLTMAHFPPPSRLNDEVASASTPEIQKTPFKRHMALRVTPRVCWAQHVRIFSGHTQDAFKATSQPKPKPTPSTSILVYRDPSPAKEVLSKPLQGKQGLDGARGRRPHRAYVEVPHPGVTMRSRSRSRSRPKSQAFPLISCDDTPSGMDGASSSTGPGLNDPHVLRQTSTGTRVSAASATRLVTTSSGLKNIPVCRLEGRCACTAPSTSTGPYTRRKEASHMTTIASSSARLDSSSVLLSVRPTKAPLGGRASNQVDRWFLRFGIVYSVFVSLMLLRIFGIW
ncbi:hypothetical protein C8Q70DRAFT_1051096 [Cubamyces menziesii]|nr:hypothetical protein C8Q70DRAFT_1051096 [Cubamyces menziesii]